MPRPITAPCSLRRRRHGICVTATWPKCLTNCSRISVGKPAARRLRKTENKDNVIRGAEMAKHLAPHGVKVQILTIPAADIDVANAILSYIADISGTLIVMGGYGHARLREIILGGVTRDMLKSMTVPVFMSH